MYKIVKRIMDIMVALIFSIILLPIFIIIFVAIKIEDGGPIFYHQIRTGKNGKNFKLYKFRSMNVLPLELEMTVPHNQRITKVGKFLRKTSIDELPQVINILKGEMSLIGPRPWKTEYYELFTEEQKQRCDVLPGITGLAQSKGRNGISIFDKIKYDIEYAKNVSFKMDLQIILDSIVIIFKREHAEIMQEDIKTELEQLSNQTC